MQARDPLDLAFRRKALVKPLDPEFARPLRPGSKPLLPTHLAALGGIRVVAGEIGAHPDHRFECDRLGNHVIGVPPAGAPYLLAGLEEVAHDGVVAVGLAHGMPGALDLAPLPAHPAVQLVEQLRLQYPLLLLAAAAEAVDAVFERAVALAIELVDQARRKTPVGFGP